MLNNQTALLCISVDNALIVPVLTHCIPIGWANAGMAPCLISMVKFVDPGMTLLAPGHADMDPTVHTRLGSTPPTLAVVGRLPPPHVCSMLFMASAAAARGSLLIAIGTVPA